jgi:hypothetical protein
MKVISMSDFGPATGSGELNVGSAPTAVFLEIHTQNSVVSAITSGVPGGLAGPSSAQNNLAPSDFSGVTSSQAYGTVSNGNAVTPQFVNYQSTLPNVMFRFKNPA